MSPLAKEITLQSKNNEVNVSVISDLNPMAKEFNLQSKNNEVNVPVFSDKGHGHSCLGVVTQECDLPKNRSISQYYGYMIDEYGHTINSTDTSTERLPVAVNYNTYANSTCTFEHMHRMAR